MGVGVPSDHKPTKPALSSFHVVDKTDEGPDPMGFTFKWEETDNNQANIP